MRKSLNMNSTTVHIIAAVIYVLAPLVLEFTTFGFLGYRTAPHQMIRANAHEVLQSMRVCKADDCDNVPDIWRDKQTGATYRSADFIEHRSTEARRLGWTWFAYGLLGCLGVGWAVARYDGRRLPQAMMATLAVATLVSVMIYLEVAP